MLTPGLQIHQLGVGKTLRVLAAATLAVLCLAQPAFSAGADDDTTSGTAAPTIAPTCGFVGVHVRHSLRPLDGRRRTRVRRFRRRHRSLRLPHRELLPSRSGKPVPRQRSRQRRIPFRLRGPALLSALLLRLEARTAVWICERRRAARCDPRHPLHGARGNSVVERKDAREASATGYAILDTIRDDISSATYLVHPDPRGAGVNRISYSPAIDLKVDKTGHPQYIYDPERPSCDRL